MTTGEKIIQKAKTYKGKSGGFVWDYWSGLPRGASWCVGFVLYILYKCGLKKEIYNPSKTSNPFWLPTIEEWLHKHATHVKMADARPGDIVIFTWTGGGNNARKIGKCSRDHIGFIREKGSSSACYTIEGNTSGGKVDEKTRKKTYIFAIYRLDCCKDTEEVQKVETRNKKQYQGDMPTLPDRGFFKTGDKGEDVELLQILLNWALTGAFMGGWIKKLKIDGEAGPQTIRAVKLLQEIHHIKVDGEFGSKSWDVAYKMKLTGALMAVNWAVAISKDNSFAYGEGERAHHGGCYFCGTNITGPKKAKKGSRWEKTYCCNPFIFAAYAHGAKAKKILAACKKGKCGGMAPGDWTKYGCFKKVGKCKNVKFDDLKVGDVIICKKPNHVWMYTGVDGIVEASGGNWSENSIRHKNGAEDRYKDYQKASTAYVMRYTD